MPLHSSASGAIRPPAAFLPLMGRLHTRDAQTGRAGLRPAASVIVALAIHCRPAAAVDQLTCQTGYGYVSDMSCGNVNEGPATEALTAAIAAAGLGSSVGQAECVSLGHLPLSPMSPVHCEC